MRLDEGQSFEKKHCFNIVGAVVVFRDVEHSGTSSAPGISSIDSGIKFCQSFIQFRNQLKSFQEFQN